ncbi:MAG: hypothetical protein K9H48_16490 [Melioribacteraceae bacterium]|nr:hypothetical protein [Saprospiraceae bacterium]MCF8356051.1 hypothetical protein [Melioribacteraceae bacterium]MCF8395514.1 hypothetical protein [Melioribacteraceae bacterium]
MRFTEDYYNKFPELEEDFIKITSTILALEKCCVEIVHPKFENGNIMHPQTFNFHIYIQAVLNRVIDLLQSIITCILKSNFASALILVRAFYENTSSIFLASLKIDKYIQTNDLNNLHKMVLKLLYGSRSNKQIKQRIKIIFENDSNQFFSRNEFKKILYADNIMEVISEIETVIPNYSESYNNLSEFTHPNYDGLAGLYCDWENKFTVKISKPSKYDKTLITLVCKLMITYSDFFIESYDSILKLMPKFDELTTDYINKNTI